MDVVQAEADAFVYTLVKAKDQIVGYGVMDKQSGSICQLTVAPEFRHQKIDDAILLDLARQTSAREQKQ